MPTDLKLSVEAVQVNTKAARLRALMPLIEAKIEEGARHADILRALNEQGFELNKNTYLSILQRHRQKRVPGKAFQTNPRPGAATSMSQQHTSASGNGLKRPPTFEHDPRGIPDLLK